MRHTLLGFVRSLMLHTGLRDFTNSSQKRRKLVSCNNQHEVFSTLVDVQQLRLQTCTQLLLHHYM